METNLAARLKTSVLIDLEAKAILIKSLGAELLYLPSESWSATHLATVYCLRERPPVNRRKINPVAGVEQDPISLADMPRACTLQFSPR
jgi:hypothetical protein